jgi:hypothetical protein
VKLRIHMVDLYRGKGLARTCNRRLGSDRSRRHRDGGPPTWGVSVPSTAASHTFDVADLHIALIAWASAAKHFAVTI